MIATAPPAGVPADAWAELADADRVALAAACAEQDAAELWAEASRAGERPEWPALARVIRSLGGVGSMGQIARADVPGGLWRRDGGYPYDELPLALVSAGFDRRYADMTGDELIAELWTAWNEWQAHQAAGLARADVEPEPAAAAGERPAEPQPGSTIAAGAAWVPVIAPPVQGPTAERSARPDVAPLAEPDVADVEWYEATDLFGVGPAPLRKGGDPDVIRRGLDAVAAERYRWRSFTRPMPGRTRRRRLSAWMVQELEARDAPEPVERSRLRVLPDPPPARGKVAAGQRTDVRTEDLTRSAMPPSDRIRWLFVAGILAALAWSVAGIVLLAASIAGADVPAVVWPLALSLPAIGAGVLPVALPARPAQPANESAAVRPARRRAA